MSTENTHRDIRQQLFQALDAITARLTEAGIYETTPLSAARRWLNLAINDLIDAEREARAEAARGVES